MLWPNIGPNNLPCTLGYSHGYAMVYRKSWEDPVCESRRQSPAASVGNLVCTRLMKRIIASWPPPTSSQPNILQEGFVLAKHCACSQSRAGYEGSKDIDWASLE